MKKVDEMASLKNQAVMLLVLDSSTVLFITKIQVTDAHDAQRGMILYKILCANFDEYDRVHQSKFDKLIICLD
jgi:hypothetical protein